MTSQPPGKCQMMGGASAWASDRTAGVRHNEARTEVRDNGSYGWLHPSHPHSHQTMDLRVIGAQSQLYHQCPQCLRGQEDPGTHVKTEIPTGNQEAI